MFPLILFSAALLAGGGLAVINFLLEKKSNKDEIIKKITPLQGGIGIAVLVIGFIAFFKTINAIELFFIWLAILIPVLSCIVLGLLLSANLIGSFLKDKAKEKIDAIKQKIARWQTPIGWIAIGFGLFFLFLAFFIMTNPQILRMFGARGL